MGVWMHNGHNNEQMAPEQTPSIHHNKKYGDMSILKAFFQI